jgi:hypothetical protein
MNVMESSEALGPEQGIDEVARQQQGDGDTYDVFEIHSGTPSYAVATGHIRPCQGKEADDGDDENEVGHGELLFAASGYKPTMAPGCATIWSLTQ